MKRKQKIAGEAPQAVLAVASDRDTNTHLLLTEEMYRAWDFFNTHFGCKMTRPVITIATKGKHKFLAWFAHDIWEKDGVKIHEINICGETLVKGVYQALESILHEMTHQRNRDAGIVDNNAAQRHNRAFKDQAEKMGLSVPKSDARFGWARTVLTAETTALIDTVFKPNLSLFTLFRNEFNTTKDKKDKVVSTLAPVMIGVETKKEIEAGAKALGMTMKDFTESAVKTYQQMPSKFAGVAQQIWDGFESFESIDDIVTILDRELLVRPAPKEPKKAK